MKNVILFVLILILCGSLKNNDKGCPEYIQVSSFLNGKLVNQYASPKPFIRYEKPNNYKDVNGRPYMADSITFSFKY